MVDVYKLIEAMKELKSLDDNIVVNLKQLGRHNRYTFRATLNGDIVATGEVVDNDDGTANVQDIVVKDEYRRQGIATMIYDHIEKELGVSLEPSSDLTDMGYQFWADRRSKQGRMFVFEEITEASPDTLEGSFTEDLITSKEWLCRMLSKILKGKPVHTIYALASWYGNIGLYLEEAGIDFKRLVCVETDQDKLEKTNDVLIDLKNKGKLVLLHQDANDVVYDKPGLVINTSCNETGPVFLTKIPDNMLCVLQARNNVDNVLIDTDDLEDFKEYFPLKKVYYSGQKELADPETEYSRYMIIGRSGKKLDETSSTGMGGGSAGVGGGSMVGGPETYEQENDKFKSKGPRRITAMTNEAFSDSYPYTNPEPNVYNFDGENGLSYIVFFRYTDENKGIAEVQLELVNKEKTIFSTRITGTGNAFKVFGTVAKIIQEFLSDHPINTLLFYAHEDEPSRIKLYDKFMQQVDKALPNYQPSEYYWGSGDDDYVVYALDRIQPAKTKIVTEVFDQSYNYDEKQVTDKMTVYNFMTDKNIPYKIRIYHDSLSRVSKLEFSTNRETGITGTRDEFKVLSTVLKAIKEHADQYKPETISFIGATDEPSRTKLYTKIAKSIPKYLSNYQFDEMIPGRNQNTFIIKKKYRLMELTEKPYPYQIIMTDPDYYRFEFTTDKNIVYTVTLTIDIGLHPNEFDDNFNIDPTKAKNMDIVFTASQGDDYVTDITGTGDAFRVFSTITDIIKKAVTRIQPDMITMAASIDEPSRVRLYRSLASRLAKVLPTFTYYTKRQDDINFVEYVLVRRDMLKKA